MQCDLHSYFSQFASGLPTDEKHRLPLNADSFSVLPSVLETDQIVVRKAQVDYDGARVDRLQFFASRAVYQEFGLLILSVVFLPGGSRVHLKLTNTASMIKNIIVEYAGVTNHGVAYRTRPHDFLFSAGAVQTYPWANQRIDIFSLPRFRLTNLKQFVVTEDHWAQRDTIFGFGNDEASVLLAELLLRMGSPLNETNEIALEGEGGFRGVGVHSAEASFYLPGSLPWPEGVELSNLFSG